MKITPSLAALLLGLAATQALACYTVYDRGGRVVYNGSEPPVDMSRPLRETLSARYPGGHMVFDTQTDCDSVSPASTPIARRGAPLLTDRRTAEAMRVPYKVLQGAIVMVEPRDARVRPGVTVVPAESLALAPATVITELRDPPLTIVQSGEGVVISEAPRR